MVKRVNIILFVFLVVIFTLSFSCAVNADTTSTCVENLGYNTNAQNYTNGNRWANNSYSYLTETLDGKLMLVCGSVQGKMVIEYYNSNLEFVSAKVVASELPKFGAFYSDGQYYYVITGQENDENNDETEVLRVTKYNNNWEKMGSAGIYGANTKDPFRAGSCRVTHSGDYLFIHTCHLMYGGHQANLTVKFKISDISISDYRSDVSNVSTGYVSHSFNQFVAVENDKLITLDHGDANPRSIVLINYSTDISSGTDFLRSYSGKISTNVISFTGTLGANDTGGTVGGFEVTPTSYLIAGTMVPDGTAETELCSEVRNVYVAAVDKSTKAISFKFVTNDATDVNTYTVPHLVSTSVGNILVYSNWGTIYYAKVDADGSIGTIRSMKGFLSDCKPIEYNGSLVWFVTSGTDVIFYRINLLDLSAQDSIICNNDHDYQFVSSTSTTAKYVCLKCSADKEYKLSEYVTPFWSANGSTFVGSNRSFANQTIGGHVFYIVNYTDTGETFDSKVVASDESIINHVPYSTEYGRIDFVKCGKVTITISQKGNDSPTSNQKKIATFNVAHDTSKFVHYTAVEPKCDKDGNKEYYFCPTCGGTFGDASGNTEIVDVNIPATGHDMTHYEAVSSTCTSDGNCEYWYCNECQKYYLDAKGRNETTLDATKISSYGGHSLTHFQKAATCVSGDYDYYKCDRCSKIFANAESTVETTIEASTGSPNTSAHSYTDGFYYDDDKKIGYHYEKCSLCENKRYASHSFGDYVVVTQATDEINGEQYRICVKCGYKEVEIIPATSGHTHNLEYVEATVDVCEGGVCSHYQCKNSADACLKYFRDAEGREEISAASLVEIGSGHSYKNAPMVPASYIAKGKTEGIYCEICNKILLAQSEISSLDYVVVYNGNGADSGTMKNQTGNAFGTGFVQNNGYSKVGYTFDGYNTLADGTGTDIAVNYKLSDLAPFAESGAGTVTLYAKWKKDIVFVTDIYVSALPKAMKKDSSYSYITAYAKPSNADNRNLSISSSNTDVITISYIGNNNYKIVSKNPGTSILTWSATDGSGISESYSLICGNIIINPWRIDMIIGEEKKLNYTYSPVELGNYGFNFISSNASVVTVDRNGHLFAVGEGNATVYCESKLDGSIKDYASVTVSKKDIDNSNQDDKITSPGTPATDQNQNTMEKINSFVSRMYTVVLNREAEEDGLAYWSNELAHGNLDGATLSSGFILGAEFKARGLNNSDYIDVLYATFFDREGDVEGKAYWMSQLSSGISREKVLSSFVNSAEFGNICTEYGIARGTMEEDGTAIFNSGVRNFVLRNYTTALGREGELDGVEYWSHLINTKQKTALDCAMDFFHSKEFLNKNLNDEDYIECLYGTYFGRASDAEGKNYWLTQMRYYGMTRDVLLSQFAHSKEFSMIMSQYGL